MLPMYRWRQLSMASDKSNLLAFNAFVGVIKSKKAISIKILIKYALLK